MHRAVSFFCKNSRPPARMISDSFWSWKTKGKRNKERCLCETRARHFKIPAEIELPLPSPSPPTPAWFHTSSATRMKRKTTSRLTREIYFLTCHPMACHISRFILACYPLVPSLTSSFVLCADLLFVCNTSFDNITSRLAVIAFRMLSI